jgi:hypothetical protein
MEQEKSSRRTGEHNWLPIAEKLHESRPLGELSRDPEKCRNKWKSINEKPRDRRKKGTGESDYSSALASFSAPAHFSRKRDAHSRGEAEEEEDEEGSDEEEGAEQGPEQDPALNTGPWTEREVICITYYTHPTVNAPSNPQ